MNIGTLSLAFLLACGASSAAASDKADIKLDPLVRYDATTVIEFKATILGFRETAKTAPLDGLYLMVKTDPVGLKAETFEVYVGPTDFVKAFDATFAKGDKIEVIGSKVKLDGVDLILAREVTRKQTTLILRDKTGEPFWKNWAGPPQK